MDAVRKAIEERQKEQSTIAATSLSGATTLPQRQRELQQDQEQAGLCQLRSDLGSTRAVA